MEHAEEDVASLGGRANAVAWGSVESLAKSAALIGNLSELVVVPHVGGNGTCGKCPATDEKDADPERSLEATQTSAI